jgi:hypothetical protein
VDALLNNTQGGGGGWQDDFNYENAGFGDTYNQKFNQQPTWNKPAKVEKILTRMLCYFLFLLFVILCLLLSFIFSFPYFFLCSCFLFFYCRVWSLAEELFTQAKTAYKGGKHANAKKDLMQVLETDVINGHLSVWYVDIERIENELS